MNTHSDSNSNRIAIRIRDFETILINFEFSANALSLLTAYILMLILNSLRLEIHISEHYAIISSTSHINSKHQSASFLILIQNFLQFYVLSVKYSEFNLQYLNVGEAREKIFENGIEDDIKDILKKNNFTAISTHTHS